MHDLIDPWKFYLRPDYLRDLRLWLELLVLPHELPLTRESSLHLLLLVHLLLGKTVQILLLLKYCIWVWAYLLLLRIQATTSEVLFLTLHLEVLLKIRAYCRRSIISYELGISPVRVDIHLLLLLLMLWFYLLSIELLVHVCVCSD
jgi:hypothetical protein